MYMLDTNTISYFVQRNENVVKKLKEIEPNQICLSTVVVAELLYGVRKRNNKKLETFINLFLDSVEILDWDYETAECYGSLRARMESKGQIMGSFDQMIAAHALRQKDCILVTNDKAFSMVENLKLENWLV